MAPALLIILEGVACGGPRSEVEMVDLREDVMTAAPSRNGVAWSRLLSR
jgi:hypothetical protein